jgi:hypothetical protein
MAHFHQFAGVIVEDCIEHYDGEFSLGESCWLQWCLGDLNIGFNACQYHLFCLIDLTSVVQLGLAIAVLLRIFWAGLLWGHVVPLSGRRFPILAASIFLWNSAILLDYHGSLGCCGDDLSVVSLPVFSSPLGSMAYSRATLGTAAVSWLSLSTSLGDCRGIDACCVGAVILRSSFPSVLGF